MISIDTKGSPRCSDMQVVTSLPRYQNAIVVGSHQVKKIAIASFAFQWACTRGISAPRTTHIIGRQDSVMMAGRLFAFNAQCCRDGVFLRHCHNCRLRRKLLKVDTGGEKL